LISTGTLNEKTVNPLLLYLILESPPIAFAIALLQERLIPMLPVCILSKFYRFFNSRNGTNSRFYLYLDIPMPESIISVSSKNGSVVNELLVINFKTMTIFPCLTLNLMAFWTILKAMSWYLSQSTKNC